MYSQIYGWMDGLMGGCVFSEIYGWIDELMGGWMDRWIGFLNCLEISPVYNRKEEGRKLFI